MVAQVLLVESVDSVVDVLLFVK